ncbi:valine--tRNA ligase [Lacipirellula parvula]|uniref:Valine--tRNA ligase n=1 Tax=Lacipirellula parvula TaxID=2650471 RepID=A0A5K7X571_9BACT|nr:valine--tRNA ligase [Lacipirellula parvula]BBO31688.1 valyl-tRNA synthetase [Lacipirellula parvula]
MSDDSLSAAGELPSQYDHEGAQRRWYKVWEQRGYFHAEPGAKDKDGKVKPPYTIVIPPPNVTGALHLGHALNNTLQDILIRMKRMQGFNALWMPGTDHAGIATQAVVERRLLEEQKLSRHDLGREGLIEKIWEWKAQYEKRIIGQLKQIGCSCDWERLRFTLDETCARAVRETFFRLFQDGKIYRGKRLVNWDTYLQTAVSDDEVFKEPVKGHFWHFKYPVVKDAKWKKGEPEFVTIATTRPETMLGDTAVAVHPDPAAAFDKVGAELRERMLAAPAKEKGALEEEATLLLERRARMLPHLETLRDMAQRGVMLELPLTGRQIPLIADEWAKPELGSGCVKITPAHDENDYAVWQRNLEIGAINIMTPDGKLNENAPKHFRGMSMKQGRQQVLDELEMAGLYNPETDCEDREIELPHSDRSKTPIEPYLADQWFVKMDELAQSAMDAVTDGRVKITPERYGKTYLDWLGEKRDWPIGRQLWWGHRIPVWHIRWCDRSVLEKAFDGRNDIFWNEGYEKGWWFLSSSTDLTHLDETRLEALAEESKPGGKFAITREEDVLDTWFSSALWPHSTLGWPDETPELKAFYPTTALVTSRDIITLWVARMVLTGRYNMGEVPFSSVYIHPKILDGYGETMSKSKGNGVDPLDVVEKFGADALRFGLAYLATETQDVRMPVEFECPHCQTLIAQTKKNRTLVRIECDKCGKPFRTQWAESHGTDEDKALARGAVVSDRFELGRRFCNKLWNASRFSLMNLQKAATGGRGAAPEDATTVGGSNANAGTATTGRGFIELTLEDRWLLSRLATVTNEVTAAIESYQFADAARLLYAFAWNDFCDYYVEMTKARFGVPEQQETAQRVLAHVLDALLRLLHPMIPFLTEEVWQLLGQVVEDRGLEAPGSLGSKAAVSVCIADWPVADASRIDATIETQFADFQAVLGAVRELRMGQNIAPREAVEFSVRCDEATAKLLEPMSPYFLQMAKATALAWGPKATAPETAASSQVNGARGPIDVHLDVSRFIDVEAEKKRLTKQIEQWQGFVKSMEAKLNNESFVSRAPAEVVQQQRDKLVETKGLIESAQASLKKLG